MSAPRIAALALAVLALSTGLAQAQGFMSELPVPPQAPAQKPHSASPALMRPCTTGQHYATGQNETITVHGARTEMHAKAPSANPSSLKPGLTKQR